MASLIVAHWVPVYGALLLVVLGMFMYLQNTCRPDPVVVVDGGFPWFSNGSPPIR